MFDCGGPAPARHILGNYEIFEEVGRGGMGIVYRALDLSLDRIVAVKVLRDDLRAQSQIVSRFSREAKAAACLDHANIVQIYAVGNAGGTPYIAMEFVDAIPLSMLMQRESCLSCDQALDIAAQVSSALACAHEAHVIHRDIKPPNILIADRGKAYVTDFGIAKILSVDDNLTVDGSRLGTPHYMSPERCKNGELTSSSDLYSLGVLLFQMLTGRLPYEAGSSIELIRKIVSNPPTRLRRFRGDVPEDVERLVAWMIEKQPNHRPPNCTTVCEAIDRVRRGKPLDLRGNSVSAAIAEFRNAAGKRATPETPADKPGNQASGLTPITENRSAPRWRWAARSVAIAALAMTAIAGTIWVVGPDPSGAEAWDPGVSDPQRWFANPSVARFEDEAPGVVRAPFNLAGFYIQSITNDGDGATFTVQLRGAENTHQEGRRVVCEIEPVQRYAGIVVPPDMPLLHAAESSQTIAPAIGFHLGDEAGASGNVAAFAVHPDGVRFAVSVSNGRGRTELLEWTRSATGKLEPGRQLAPDGAPIEYLQYSPDGKMLAFIRNQGQDDHSLWLLPADRHTAVSVPLARGNLSLTDRAFNPDGTLLAFASMSPDGQSTVRLVRTTDRQIETELGKGWDVSWHPSGAMLVGTAADRKGFDQVWTFEATSPYRRSQLTHLDGGTSRACALSENGRWAATSLDSTPEPTLVLTRIDGAGI
jgi:serine/threonine protein kinase